MNLCDNGLIAIYNVLIKHVTETKLSVRRTFSFNFPFESYKAM